MCSIIKVYRRRLVRAYPSVLESAESGAYPSCLLRDDPLLLSRPL